MSKKVKRPIAQAPLMLRCHRLMEAFAKSDDERDFYLDRVEGFIVYVDLDKDEKQVSDLLKELESNEDRYSPIPKLTFFEAKKIMEGFIQEKVYDIDTKEKLFDIISSKEARENFLEFIYDHHSELEKWQQYYQERSRIRIIEWLRNNKFHFIFEEDLDITKNALEKLKKTLFQARVSKDILVMRKALETKAKTYYSSEALNPRPKRGRPPKQVVKAEAEPQVTIDLFMMVPPHIRPFLFIPEISTAAAVTFSSKFEVDQGTAMGRKSHPSNSDLALESLNQKLAALRSLSSTWLDGNKPKEDSVAAKASTGGTSYAGETRKESGTPNKKAETKPSGGIVKKRVTTEPEKTAPKTASKTGLRHLTRKAPSTKEKTISSHPRKRLMKLTRTPIKKH